MCDLSGSVTSGTKRSASTRNTASAISVNSCPSISYSQLIWAEKRELFAVAREAWRDKS